jgi:hypothetical protein
MHKNISILSETRPWAYKLNKQLKDDEEIPGFWG